VEDREYHVEVDLVLCDNKGSVRHPEGRRPPAGMEGPLRRVDNVPPTVTADPDRNDTMTALDESVMDGDGRNARHLVLGGPAAE
jgi:hypothetical protein